MNFMFELTLIGTVSPTSMEKTKHSYNDYKHVVILKILPRRIQRHIHKHHWFIGFCTTRWARLSQQHEIRNTGKTSS